MPRVYHVAKNGDLNAPGSEEQPFLTIQQAAEVAQAGDTVVVHEGIYREHVDPQFGGHSDGIRITYEAAEGEHVIIKGSEEIKDWKKVEGTVWRTVIPNDYFGDFNPYVETVHGDWLVTPQHERHLGDVYLNGMSFYEASDYEALFKPEVRTEMLDHWTREDTAIRNPEQTKYLWYCEVDEDNTVIYANFHDADPTVELIEINVRPACFYPSQTGLNYITVRGFEMSQAASPWAPPTADQPGLIGPHWSKGWIIEDNVIHDAKCSAISLGKEKTTGHNERTYRGFKPGYSHQLESVFKALHIGWSKETIGSHIVRRNTVYDCGQNAVVGHLGCAFSEIYDNHFYNIAIKREFYGHEIAGIKLHAAIDVLIDHNLIHDCSLGIWLDWQAQGTRISRNVLYRNNRDLFIEVTHGPHLVDNNILGSRYSLDNHAQGGAYVNNLFAGKMILKKILDRATPYHYPHSTEVLGFTITHGGDDRFFKNIFAAVEPEVEAELGTSVYRGYHENSDAYFAELEAGGQSDHELFFRVQQPVYMGDNLYLDGAQAFSADPGSQVHDEASGFAIEEDGDNVYVHLKLPETFEEMKTPTLHMNDLVPARFPDQAFTDIDGKAKPINRDLPGNLREAETHPGPLTELKAGENRIRVW